MSESISIQQARKLALLSQRLPPKRQVGPAIDATLAAIEHLGYIQIDTISVVQRAHHHTLWNRNPRYDSGQLDALVADRHVFEYWSHAAAYLPFRDFRFSLPRKHALASGKLRHWFQPEKRTLKNVLKRIDEEGPLMAKDFENTGNRTGEWKAKPAKQALEHLFMQGDLMVSGRHNFQKIYDLTERVLPAGVDTSIPSPEEYARFLITRYLQANGLGQAAEMAYLRKGQKQIVVATLRDMVSTGDVVVVDVEGHEYHVLPTAMELLSAPLSRTKLKILSPFDNLVIQRKRLQTLFDFDYLIECYVPAPKRRYGYFSLPILWGGNLVARMDCVAERNQSQLHIRHLALEKSIVKLADAFADALRKELKLFLRFNGCEKIRLHKTSPAKAKSEVRRVLNDIVG